jgi:enhancing lycopene biosynthesis protein 2
MSKRVAVVLSGCGVYDGSEIHEAVSILIALDKHKAQVTCVAPDIPQRGVVNHKQRTDDPFVRNVLAESARIARGKIKDIATVKAADFDALLFPGGFGAARNLSTFASDGSTCKVEPGVARLLLDMHAAKKPIGLACIAPALAAAVFGGKGLKPLLTIGNDAGTANTLEAMGAQHRNTGVTDICVDSANKLVTTPCYMSANGPWEVFQGAQKMVEEVLKMA